MARLASIGFESGTTGEISYAGGSISTTRTRTGTYSLTQTSGATAYQVIASRSEIYVGFAFYDHSGSGGSSSGFVSLRNNDTSLFKVVFNGTTLAYDVYRSTTLLFSTGVMSTGAWQYIEFHAVVDATAGEVELRVNGVSQGIWSGDTGTTEINRVAFTDGTGYVQYYDDIVINDSLGIYNNSWPGQPRLWPVPINGNGSVTELTRGGTDTGANWSQVSTIPASSTSYVYGETSDLRDLYTLNTSTITVPTGSAIQNFIFVSRARIESGSGALGTSLLIDTTDIEHEKITTLAGSYLVDNYCFPVDPDGNVPWTLDRIASVEVGPILKDIGT
jgi:hypothetical protein